MRYRFIHKLVYALLFAFFAINMAYAARTITPTVSIDVMYDFLSCPVYGDGPGYLGRNDDRISIGRYVEFSIPSDVVPSNINAKLNLYINVSSSSVRWMYIKQVTTTTPACTSSFYNDLFDGTTYYSADVSLSNLATIPSSAITPGGKLRIGLSTTTATSPPLRYFDYLTAGVMNLVIYEKTSDDDGDGVINGSDNCPSVANANQSNVDGDAQGDVCDADSDNDGVPGTSDKFPLNGAASKDTDNDGFPDGWNAACDTACRLASGLVQDNCPYHLNIDQLNTDGDTQGNVCDADDDNDGMPDNWEQTYGFNPLVNDAGSDFDGDGISNLQEYTNGTNPNIAPTKNDYNNDGIAGWIWKGVSNGNETASQIWQLSYPLYSPNWSVPARSYPPAFPDQANWEIMTSGDFNKDGDADILWRNTTTAQWKVWQMQDGIRAAQNNLADFDIDHAWQVVGAGDTDKDGDDDIILDSSDTGYVMIWEMQDHAIINTHNIGAKPGYTVNRIGDFNKDGDVDLLFRENGTDVLAIWEIENNTLVQERSLNSTGAGYNPVCAGDFDNDGDDDIMLVNSATMQEKWFVMENYTRTQQVGGINDGFIFLGCGDYDGDGDADSLWQRTADDKIRAVLQQNWGSVKQTVYTNAFGGANGFVYRANNN